MTVASFVIMALIVGVVFYAWYYFVHRNGVYDATRGDDDARLARMRGTDRLRTTNSALRTEVGTIGEREEAERDRHGKDENSNLFHRAAGEFKEEVGEFMDAVTDTDLDRTADDQPNASGNASINAAGNAAGYAPDFAGTVNSVGGTDQLPSAGARRAHMTPQLQSYQQSYQMETGVIGDAVSTDAPSADVSQSAGAPEANVTEQPQQPQLQQQAFTTEIGAIGETTNTEELRAAADAAFKSALGNETGGGQQAVPDQDLRATADAAFKGANRMTDIQQQNQNFQAETGQIGDHDQEAIRRDALQKTVNQTMQDIGLGNSAGTTAGLTAAQNNFQTEIGQMEQSNALTNTGSASTDPVSNATDLAFTAGMTGVASNNMASALRDVDQATTPQGQAQNQAQNQDQAQQ